MEHLNNLSSWAKSVETEPKLIMEKALGWSSSVWTELTVSNVRDTFVFIGRSIEPKNIERKTMSWLSSITSYIDANPIILSVPLPHNVGSNAVETHVNLPYLGPVSLDVFLFWSSAILTRAHMFWKSRQIKSGGTSHGNGTSECPPSPPVKSTIVTGYKDKSLYKTIKECQDVKKSLRKTKDPDVVRKEKKIRLSLDSLRSSIKGENSSDGYLGMTPTSLRDARRFLTPTPRQAPQKQSE